MRKFVLIVVLAIGSIAVADIPLEETFDDYCTGQRPVPPWEDHSQSGVTIEVNADVFYGSAGKSLHFLDETSSAQAWLKGTIPARTNIVLEYYMLTKNDQYEGAFVELRGDGPVGWSGSFGAVGFGNASGGGHAGWIGYVGAGTWPEPEILPYTEDTWYKVTRTLDLVADTETIIVEEVGGPTSDPYIRSGVAGVNTGIFGINIWTSGSQGADCYIDEIKVTPTPGAALLGVIGLGMVAWFKKRRIVSR